jgi:hypothetical protein
MNRRPHVGAWRPGAGSALTPHYVGSQSTSARLTARESLRFWPRDQLAALLSLPRRMGSGLSGSYKLHSQDVRDSVRG